MFRSVKLSLAALVCLAAAGCGPQAAVRAPCPAGKVCLEYGNGAEPVSLDPHKTTGTWEDRILQEVLMGLTTDSPAGEPVPGMAERWTVSPDGLTWTFYLRDALWSDGVPVTADDFVFSLRRILKPETAAEYASLLYFIKNAQQVNEGKAAPEALGVRAVSPKVLEIRLEHPAPYLLELAKHNTMLPVPKHVVEKWGDAWSQPEHYVGNGPYVLKSWRLGDRITVEKNPRFYDAANVCIDRVDFFPTTDSISAERRVRRGELDVNTDIESNRIGYLRERIPQYVRTNTYLGVTYLAFNANVPALKDKRVRLALDMAIDRDFIAGKLLRGGQKPAYTFTPPGVANYTAPPAPAWAAWPLEKRQAEARKLLAEAGYGPGHPLKITIKHRNTPDPMLYTPSVQNDWREIGVETALEQNEVQIAYASYRARDFQVADAAWIADYNDPMSFLYLMQSDTGAQNYGDYKNPAYDALLAKADNEPDTKKRAADLAQAGQLMQADAPVAPLYFAISKNLVTPALDGWVDNIIDHHRIRYMCLRKAPASSSGSPSTKQ
ncbi:peptide ABC transporter substrate-binding protein [Phenylobacterium sp.]|uniref:peptide ABC transporter substrate-binding protein n=1 Tax=Phenylobacterium sp. TaxID=1871053 RepID=UPI0035B3E419